MSPCPVSQRCPPVVPAAAGCADGWPPPSVAGSRSTASCASCSRSSNGCVPRRSSTATSGCPPAPTPTGWLLRAALLGGQDGLRDASTLQPVTVEVRWSTAMGLSYPSGAELSPARDDVSLPVVNAAISPTAAAFRRALLAGVRTAAAEEAVRRLDAEIAVTRRRLRALDKRWLPRLRDELVRLELTLEQTEQEDTLRLRRAAATTADGRAQP